MNQLNKCHQILDGMRPNVSEIFLLKFRFHYRHVKKVPVVLMAAASNTSLLD